MASFDQAIAYLLDLEGGRGENPHDRGGYTSYGITEAVAREFGYDVRTITLAQAVSIYRAKYWRHDGIQNQRVATKSFEIGVNGGVSVGIRLLQRAANRVCGSKALVEDGLIGPNTEGIVNGLDQVALLQALSDEQVLFYASIINENAKKAAKLIRRVDKKFQLQAVFALGWMRRAIEKP